MVAPPGTGVWGVAAGPTQLALTNLVCVWNMGANYTDATNDVALLDALTPHGMTFSYGQQADVGPQTINVNCSNAVSSQTLTMDVTVAVWDIVTLGELTCASSTLWNHSVTCQLTIVHFSSGACFEWDMGDGEPLVYYRDRYCAANVAASAPTYVQVILSKYVKCI